MSSDIGTEIVGLRLRNPFILAAGILGITGHTLRRVAEAGAGAVVTKSFGLAPRTGYANPTVVEVQGGLLNAMGLPNPGIDAVFTTRRPNATPASARSCGTAPFPS